MEVYLIHTPLGYFLYYLLTGMACVYTRSLQKGTLSHGDIFFLNDVQSQCTETVKSIADILVVSLGDHSVLF